MAICWLSPSSALDFCQFSISLLLASIALLPPRGLLLVRGLELENVTIPETAILASSETFRCDFQLGSDTLYSLKWYKDGNEFFRVVTKNERLAPIETFKLPGINVDLRRSDLHKVTLTNVSIESSGLYKCEVSAEKSFRTISRDGNFTVIVPPERGKPTISNISNLYHMGDTIKGNCSAVRTRPPANLTFLINGDKADPSLLIRYDTTRETSGLENSILGLQFVLNNDHFRRGVLRLTCVASISTREWRDERIIEHKNFYNLHVTSAGQRIFAPGSACHSAQSGVLALTCLLLGIFASLGFHGIAPFPSSNDPNSHFHQPLTNKRSDYFGGKSAVAASPCNAFLSKPNIRENHQTHVSER